MEDNQAIAEEAVRFFQAQFHEDHVPTEFGIIENVPHMITREQNQNLTKLPIE